MSRTAWLASAAIASALASVPAHAEDLTLTLDNQASAAVKEFYASPVDANAWQDNILGQPLLDPGASLQIKLRDGRNVCTYDLRFVFADNEETEEQAVNLCDTGSYTIADPPADD